MTVFGVLGFLGAMTLASIIIYYIGKLFDSAVFKLMDGAINILKR